MSKGISVIVRAIPRSQRGRTKKTERVRSATLKTGSNPVHQPRDPFMSCSWPSRCPFSPARQSWQIGRSG